jgi:hypothetical protein
MERCFYCTLLYHWGKGGWPVEYIVFDFCASFRQVNERFMGMVIGCLDLPLGHACMQTQGMHSILLSMRCRDAPRRHHEWHI